MDDIAKSFFLGFIKVHILHHAVTEPVYGIWLIDELEHHGYKVSPGTLYPILHSLEKEGLLKSNKEAVKGKIRKYYRTTPKGKEMLRKAKLKIQELIKEVMK